MAFLTHEEYKELLFTWFLDSKINGAQLTLTTGLIDILYLQGIEYCIEEPCCCSQGMLFIGILSVPLFCETDGIDYFVTEIIEPNVLVEKTAFNGWDTTSTMAHIKEKYAYLI